MTPASEGAGCRTPIQRSAFGECPRQFHRDRHVVERSQQILQVFAGREIAPHLFSRKKTFQMFDPVSQALQALAQIMQAMMRAVVEMGGAAIQYLAVQTIEQRRRDRGERPVDPRFAVSPRPGPGFALDPCRQRQKKEPKPGSLIALETICGESARFCPASRRSSFVSTPSVAASMEL
jgi:hypothetical protein